MTASSPALLHADFFTPDGVSQGISHRAAQIAELLDRVGASVVRVEVNPAAVSKPAGLAWGLRHLWVRGYRAPHRLPLLGRYGRQLAALVRFFRAQPPGSCVVWCVSGGWLVPHAAAQCGLPVLAVPMMTEALVEFAHDTMGGGSRWDKLRFEVRRLAMAHGVICASREEQWFFNGLGLDADYLPIYPAATLTDHLLELRRRRDAATREHVLLLSSHTNPPNRAGVLRLAHMLAATPGLRPPVVLAGLDTERFRGQVPDGILTIEGTVSQTRLDELLVGAKAMLIHQRFGTGALTRIPEALVAGVPVVCNGVAARSAHHYDGVHTFETADELAHLLACDLTTPPVPPRPEAAEKRFIDTVRRVVGLPPS